MLRILVIDDEKDIRTIYRTILECEGFEVEEAADGMQGLNLFRKNPADLIITDIMMPEKEGIETIKEFKKDFPDVKIIAISGGGSLGSPEIYLRIANKLGAVRTFQKPVHRQELVSSVCELINPESDHNRRICMHAVQ